MGEIQTYRAPPPARDPGRMAHGDPRPGTYWRAKTDVPEETREVVRNERFGAKGETRTDTEVARVAMPAGLLVLLRSTHVVEGRVHTLVTSGSPAVKGDKTRSWLLDDFLAWLEPVDDREAAAERAGQAGDVMVRISGIQADMAQVASGATDVNLSLPAPGDVSGQATPAVLGEARARAGAVATTVRESAKTIKALGEALTEQTGVLVAIQSEKAHAAMASVQDALALAEAAEKATASLDLFGGKHVEVMRIADGEGAPAGTPVTLFQNKLHLDEEVALHLHEGGFDHRHVEDLPVVLARHPELVDRLVPAPRGVVLVRIRREDKRYFREDAGLGAFLQQIEMQKADKGQFLLLRDGARVHLVFTETALQEARRLFPTKDELDRPFRGSDGADRIGFADTRYVDALSEFGKQALVYKRLLVLLWGLEFGEDRPLGDVDAPGRPGNWYSSDWQAEHLLFVSDDDTRSLPDARPSIEAYLDENAAALQAGSRVLVDWSRALTEESAPGCVKVDRQRDRDHVHTTHRPADDFSVHTVRKSGRVLYVDVPVFRTGYSGRVRFNARVDLTALRGAVAAYLVLDVVDPADLAHYAGSRISRRHYLLYLAMFHEARKALAAEFTAIAATDDRLARDLGVDLPHLSPDTVRAATRRAHLMFRAANAGRPPTSAQERSVRDAAVMILTGTPTPEAVSALVDTPVEGIVMAGTTGDGELVVTRPGPPDVFLRDHAWVVRTVFKAGRAGRWKRASEGVGVLERVRDPSLVLRVQSPSAPSYEKGGVLPEGISSPEDTAGLSRTLSRLSPEEVREKHVRTSSSARMLDEWYRVTRRWTFDSPPPGSDRNAVNEARHVTVVGAVSSFRHNGDDPPALYLLGIQTNLLDLAYLSDPRIGDDPTVLRGMFSKLWKQGGAFRLDELRRKAASGVALPGRLVVGAAKTVVPGLLKGEATFLEHRWWDVVNSRQDDNWRWLCDTLRIDQPRRLRPDASPSSFHRHEPDPDRPFGGRMVIRADTWELVRDLAGWKGERPAHLDLHLLPPDGPGPSADGS